MNHQPPPPATPEVVGASERRPFGTGPEVSLFSLGTMRALGSPEQMLEVLEAALDAGINHVETAPSYGPAEAYLGQALARIGARRPRDHADLVLTSKILPGASLEIGQTQLLASLERLGTGRLDNLAVHGLNRPEHLDWALHGAGARLLEWVLAQGLVGQVGFSSHGSTPLIEQALASGRFSFCSLHLHLFDQERLPLARRALAGGLGVLAISPADKGGRLYDPPAQLTADCAPLEPLRLAYRFLLAQGISSLTLGAERRQDLELAAQLRAAAGPLDNQELLALGRLEASGRARLGAERCGQCRACLPCPSGVPIPELLRLRNLALGHGMETFARERYNLIGRAGHWWEALDARACRSCAACLPRCPHGLEIPVLLADTHRRLAAAPRRRLWG
ncbi:aldo/keto reductase [Synechococcus sp. CBW1107]|uniref:aldo/keto reductase n=1 Tax=Synechococcus sp. CBW1107 TaxID=2789857 RepID=UPI0018CDE17A|nr:aldo/keto reductase [Synechococcus sp. CBW1107]QPN57200.1 aldo/keto reductase [Synechococcus sp. CBW1107]